MNKINDLQNLKVTYPNTSFRMSTVSAVVCGHKGHSIWSLSSMFIY